MWAVGIRKSRAGGANAAAMGPTTKFPGNGVRNVNRDELEAAFDAQCPVVHRGITYQRISAIIRRREPNNPRPFLQVELMGRTGSSVVIADPAKVESIGSEEKSNGA